MGPLFCVAGMNPPLERTVVGVCNRRRRIEPKSGIAWASNRSGKKASAGQTHPNRRRDLGGA